MICFPPELIEYKQWVLWKRLNVNDRTVKLPVSAWSGKAAACDKPETWTTFRHACYALRKYGADGIGFVFTANDPFAGIDLDKCREANGQLKQDASKIVQHLNSYTELSPSGAGLHIIVKATVVGSGRRTGGIEVYSAGRYFTMTGKRLLHTPKEIGHRQAELDAIIGEAFVSGGESECQLKTASRSENGSDVDLIGRALRARSGARFQKLWRGDTSDYDGDKSRADAALCRMLSYWTGGNRERIDRLFRMSALMGEKWDRKTGDDTYGARTIRLTLRP